MNQTLLKKYARLAVVMGANVQKGQTLIINTSVEAKEMTRYAVEAAYEAGAKEVVVNYKDDLISRMHYEYQTEETLCDVPDWMVEQKVSKLREGAATLHIISDTPGVLGGIDAQKISAVYRVLNERYKEASEITMANKVQWAIVAVPNVRWAKQVFPQLEEQEALESLWKKILSAVHVNEEQDAISLWKQHNKNLAEREVVLNKHNFKAMHFKNELGTDITIELVKNHIWAGGNEHTVDGVEFNPNMPTEEIFTMPYKYGVNGTVVTSKPLDYNGTLINEFSLTFKDGKVIDYNASNDYETLQSLIEFDEGSSYIGEVALVPYSSPISLSDTLFYNTLFDENASCHLALGRAYPMNVKGGIAMSPEQLSEAGANYSLTHVDFMFGSPCMKIEGICEDGTRISVFEKGDFVF